MALSFSWNIKDMSWDQSSGMILTVRADYIGEETCVVGSSSSTFTHSIDKGIVLKPSSDPIGIDTVTQDDVKGWISEELSIEIPYMKKEIYDILNPQIKQFIRDKHVVEYIGIGTIDHLSGGAGKNPNDSW